MLTAAEGQVHTLSTSETAGSVVTQDSLDGRIGQLSQQIADKIEAGQKQRIAVLEFTDLQGSVTDFGRYLSEELITRLYDSKRFKVVERQLLNKVIAEQKLSLTGVVDPASAKKLGNVLGVDAIVSGTIADRGESLKINARLISAETGEIFSAAATEIGKDKEVQALMKGGASGNRQQDANSTSSESKNAIPMRAAVSGFTFELEKCKLFAQELTCALNVINNGDADRSMYVFAANRAKDRSSRAIDGSGTEYAPSTLWIGNSRNYSSGVNSILAPGIPIKLTLGFKEVGGPTTSLSLLRIAFSTEKEFYGTPRYADFRNVSISR
jgi:TolB-like protein